MLNFLQLNTTELITVCLTYKILPQRYFLFDKLVIFKPLKQINNLANHVGIYTFKIYLYTRFTVS